MHYVENSLANLGLNDLWLYQGNGFSTNYIKLAVKRKIKDVFMQDWRAEVHQHDFCDVYSQFKSTNTLEKYITDLILPFHDIKPKLDIICSLNLVQNFVKLIACTKYFC